MKWPYITSGQWIQVADKHDFGFACCDCGLVHRIEFRVVDGEIQMKTRRDNHATANTRRRLFKEGKIVRVE